MSGGLAIRPDAGDQVPVLRQTKGRETHPLHSPTNRDRQGRTEKHQGREKNRRNARRNGVWQPNIR